MEINEVLINEPDEIKKGLTFAVKLITLFLSKLSFTDQTQFYQQKISTFFNTIKNDKYSRVLCLSILQNPALPIDFWFKEAFSCLFAKNEGNLAVLSYEERELIEQKHNLFIRLSNILVEDFTTNLKQPNPIRLTEGSELNDLLESVELNRLEALNI